LQLLADWHGSSNPPQAAALKACRAALHDEIDGETARSIFEAFAKRTGILLEKDLQVSGPPEVQPHTVH
jgi:hypothetical protein